MREGVNEVLQFVDSISEVVGGVELGMAAALLLCRNERGPTGWPQRPHRAFIPYWMIHSERAGFDAKAVRDGASRDKLFDIERAGVDNSLADIEAMGRTVSSPIGDARAVHASGDGDLCENGGALPGAGGRLPWPAKRRIVLQKAAITPRLEGETAIN